jgi:hypothetical protein
VHRVGRNTEILIDGYKDSFIPTYDKVLIRDTAGMGKSTVMKYLFLSCVQSNKGIPIFIELRKLKSGQSVVSYIYDELNPIDDEFDKDFILRLIKDGGFIFFFDGYDEIPFNQREKVTNDLQDFISKAGNNQFILTSRPDSSLASFTDFQMFNIQPLKREEAFTLLRKYDNGGELSSEIISRLKGNVLESVRDFLRNPLLVSLLYKSYEYKPIIPFKKHNFYRQVYDALFEHHDLTKGGSFIREKHSNLDIDNFHRVLRALGFITFRLGQIEFEKDRLLALIREARDRCPGISFKEGDFLKDLLTTIPLFASEGDYYRWSHKSIQEYFAAQFIWLDAKVNQDAILRKMIRNHKNETYYNLLDLYYDMDYKTFRRVVIYDLICGFIKHMKQSYRSISRKRINEELITCRKLLTFGRVYILYSEDGIANVVNQYGNIFTASDIYLPTVGVDEDKYRVYVHHSDGAIGCVDYSYQVLKLLQEKKEDLFLRRSELAEYLKGSSQIGHPWSNYHALVVNDDPTSEVNQPKYFDSVNRLILDPDPEIYLNIDKCQRLKKQIEEEIEKEASDDF